MTSSGKHRQLAAITVMYFVTLVCYMVALLSPSWVRLNLVRRRDTYTIYGLFLHCHNDTNCVFFPSALKPDWFVAVESIFTSGTLMTAVGFLWLCAVLASRMDIQQAARHLMAIVAALNIGAILVLAGTALFTAHTEACEIFGAMFMDFDCDQELYYAFNAAVAGLCFALLTFLLVLWKGCCRERWFCHVFTLPHYNDI